MVGGGGGGWVAGLNKIKANSVSQQSWSWGLSELGNNILNLMKTHKTLTMKKGIPKNQLEHFKTL